MASRIGRFGKESAGFVQSRIQSMASRQGVQYVWWPEVRARMMDHGIDMLDVRQVMSTCTVQAVEQIGAVRRYAVFGEDLEERSLRVIVVVCDELAALEIVNVELLKG